MFVRWIKGEPCISTLYSHPQVCKVFIFELDASSNSLKEVTSIDVGDDITDVKFSPDGSRLAVGTGPKKLVQLYVRESEVSS